MSNSLLADLKPLIAPPPVPWWPPAPGWWILATVLIISLCAAIIWGYRRWQHHVGTRYQREAIKLLVEASNYAPEKRLQEIAAILRRAAICAWGREKIGTQPWSAIMELSLQSDKKRLAAFDSNSIQLLTENLYRATVTADAELESLTSQAKVWLGTLPPMEKKRAVAVE